MGKLTKFFWNTLESLNFLSKIIFKNKIHYKLWDGTWDLTSLVLKKTLDKHGIDSLVVIGGNGSLTGALLLEEEHGIAPGQACVFYSKNINGFKVLGGGWIIN